MSTVTYLSPLTEPRVRVDPQLGPATGGADCAFRATQGGIRKLTGSVPTIREMRDFLGVPDAGIDMLGVKALFEKWGCDARFTRDVAEIRAALIAGYYVVAAVNYGFLNAQPYANKLAGDRRFSGGHAVGLDGTEQVDATGAYWVGWHDGLHDGRRASLPKGPAMARRKWVEACMAAMGTGTQAVIARATA